MKQKSLMAKTYPYYFVVGAVVLYTLLYVLPGIYGVLMSFTDWHSTRDISTLKFVGLENFKTIFSGDKEYFKYIGNTFWFAIVTTIFKSSLALLAALIIQKGLWGTNFHRMALFFPSIISVVVTGLVFRSLLRPNSGFINQVLAALSLSTGKVDWLNQAGTAFNTVMAVDIWRGIGYIMIIYLAGLQAIDTTYYEAAELDGAGYFAQFRYVTLPMMKQSILVNTVLNIIYGLRVFDMIYVLTRGGPGDKTDVVYTSVFREFGMGNYALGSALSSVMLAILLIIGALSIRYIINQGVEQ